MKPEKKKKANKFLKCENAKENLKGALPAGATRKCLK